MGPGARYDAGTMSRVTEHRLAPLLFVAGILLAAHLLSDGFRDEVLYRHPEPGLSRIPSGLIQPKPFERFMYAPTAMGLKTLHELAGKIAREVRQDILAQAEKYRPGVVPPMATQCRRHQPHPARCTSMSAS